MTNPFSGVRWLWVLLGGLLSEVVLMISAVPAYMTTDPDRAMSFIIPPACLVVPFLFALWITGKAKSNRILNGALVGVIAALLYAPAFFIRETMPPAFVLAEVFKVASALGGGVVAAARARGRASPAS